MSLKRSIAAMKRELDNKPSWIQDKIDNLDIWWSHTKANDYYYRLKNFFRNLKMFLGLAWNWYSWDSSHSIEVFAKLLAANARVCKNGHHVRGEQQYRRGMTMAGYLKKAYLEEHSDLTLKYLHTKTHYKIAPTGKNGWGTLVRIIDIDEAMYDKLEEIASERVNKVQAQMKKEAWEYVNKYIEDVYD